MERLYKDYRERGLAVVAVNLQESKDTVERFFKELHLEFPAVLDSDGTAARTFAVRGLPVTFLLGRNGHILWKAIGSRDWDGPEARAYFEKVLQTARP
jgi:peroxiredoxin